MEVTLSARKMGKSAIKGKGLIGHQKRQQKNCTPFASRNGFLNYTFLPLVQGEESDGQIFQQINAEFFNSMHNICNFYGIAEIDFSHHIYPVNVAKAIAYLKAEMQGSARDLQVMVLQTIDHKAVLSTVRVFDTKNTLYYLPLQPLYALLKNKHQKSAAGLLHSVCAYFFQITEVPHHSEPYSYMNCVYEGIEDWILENEDEEDKEYKKHRLSYIRKMQRQSALMLRRLKQKVPLSRFKQRLTDFVASNKVEQDLHGLALKVYDLYSKYPSRSIKQNIEEDFDEDDQGSRIFLDHYLSFIWSSKDCLYDDLMETVNAQLQEYNYIDEPMTIQFFDCPQDIENHDLTFEHTFFDLLNDLTDTLNDYTHEKYN